MVARKMFPKKFFTLQMSQKLKIEPILVKEMISHWTVCKIQEMSVAFQVVLIDVLSNVCFV